MELAIGIFIGDVNVNFACDDVCVCVGFGVGICVVVGVDVHVGFDVDNDVSIGPSWFSLQSDFRARESRLIRC